MVGDLGLHEQRVREMAGEPLVGLADVDELRALLGLLRPPGRRRSWRPNRDPRNSCFSLRARLSACDRRTAPGPRPASFGAARRDANRRAGAAGGLRVGSIVGERAADPRGRSAARRASATTARSTSPTALWWRSRSDVGHVADRRAERAVVAANREQQLVLRRRDAERGRLLLAPVQEPPQRGAEREQLAGTRASLRSAAGACVHGVYRTTICLVEMRQPAAVRGAHARAVARPASARRCSSGSAAARSAPATCSRSTCSSTCWRPQHFGAGAEFVVLGGVGVVVVLLARVLGSPGDVELLVDNIHVSGGADRVSARCVRSCRCRSLTISAGGAAGPEAPLVTTCGTLASWLARVRADRTRSRPGASRSRGWPPRSRCCSARRSAPRSSRWRSCTGAACSTTRRWCPRSSARSPATRARVVLTGAGVKPVWTIPAVGSLHAVDLLWAIGAGVGGALVAIVFTYLVIGLRRVFARRRRRSCGRSSAVSGWRCSRCGRRTRSPSASSRPATCSSTGSRSACSSSRSMAKLLGVVGHGVVGLARRVHHPAVLHGRDARRADASRLSPTPRRASSWPRSWPRPTSASPRRCSARPWSSPRWAGCASCPPRCWPRSSR